MSLLGKAVMMNWSNVAEEHRQEYYQWHNREHIAGRLAIPGFRRGRRSIAVDADRDFFNLYEVSSLAVLTGPEYRTKANHPSDATLRTGKIITDAIRALAHVRFTTGLGQGGLILTLRLDMSEAAAGRVITEIVPELSAITDVVGTHLCVADREASNFVSNERKGRPTVVPDWAVLIEGTTMEGLDRARREVLSEHRLSAIGCQGPFVFGLYALQVVALGNDLRTGPSQAEADCFGREPG